MHAEKPSAARVARQINVTDVEIAGTWMPCEYIEDRSGRVRVVMLADVDFDEPARSAVWHLTLAASVAHRLEQIEPSRKLTVRIAMADRTVADWSFQQRLKRHLLTRDE
ncbi:hypothetical protein [Paraburkholderia aspalathi]|uniref:hypothetical protein n=1 Tax=Paraburkholderia aspalathi TaxID=1324617 RepID=UPI001B0D5DAF|nr:hypothetical protein [Paraburkholderia aspalathi]CAE6841583.1 hypothetical protein R20943_07135 [Paraburkholderia aspalathi]